MSDLPLKFSTPPRRLAFLLVALVAVGLMLLPAPLPTLSLGLWVIAAVGFMLHRRLKLSVIQLIQLRSWIGVRTSALLAASACGFMVASAYYFRAETPRPYLDVAAWLMVIGGLLLGGALLAGRNTNGLVLAIPSRLVTASRQVNGWFTAAGIAALVGIAAINIVPNDSFLATISHHLQFALFVGGVILVGLGLCGVRLFTPPPNPLPALKDASAASEEGESSVFNNLSDHFSAYLSRWWREGLLLAVILVVAALPRLVALGETTRFEVDELQAMVPINALERWPDIKLLSTVKPLHWDYTWLYSYVGAELVSVFGHTWTGLRLINALVGIATVAALYWLARAWFDRWTAVLAALLLAALPVHVHFSRLALVSITDPLFGVLAFAALSWGLRTNRRAYFVLGGIFLGLTQYFYEGGRLLYPPLTALWLVCVVVLWRRQVSWRNIAWAMVTFLIVAAPFYSVMIATSRPFGERMGDNFIGWGYLFTTGSTFLAHLIQPFMTLIHDPDMQFGYIYYGGEQPVLLPYVVAFFLLGISYAVWRVRSPGMLLLLLWLVAFLLGNSLIRDNGMVVRYIVVFPAVALLAAVGIRAVPALILPRAQRVSAIVMSVLVVTLVVGQIQYYFAVHLPGYEVDFRARRPGRDLDDVVLRATQLPAGTNVHIVTDWPDVSLYYVDQVSWSGEFMLEDSTVRLLAQAELTPEYLSRVSRGENNAFFLVPNNPLDVMLLRRTFPMVSEGIPSPYPDVPADEQYILYYAARSDRP